MGMLKWKDVTSYTRDTPPEERKPTCWELTDGYLRVTVVWNHRDRPNQWCFHCAEMRCDTEPLVGVTTEEQAKRASLEVLAFRASRILDTLRMFRDATPGA